MLTPGKSTVDGKPDNCELCLFLKSVAPKEESWVTGSCVSGSAEDHALGLVDIEFGESGTGPPMDGEKVGVDGVRHG